MDNQHKKIKGYRELTTEEKETINGIKTVGEALDELITHLEAQGVDADYPLGIDKRWLSVGKTHLQQGLMALTRAVAQPTTF